MLAHCYVRWPPLDTDIENLAKDCTGRTAAAKSLIKVKPDAWLKLASAWNRIYADFTGALNASFHLRILTADVNDSKSHR